MPETIYGVRPVTEALRGGRREVSEVLDSTGNAEVAQAAKAAGVPVKKVSQARVGELARGGYTRGWRRGLGRTPTSIWKTCWRPRIPS